MYNGYPNYNPYNPVYRGTEQLMPYQQQQSMIQKVRPVSSLDEVRAAQIDFDGSVFLFPDVANKKIYTKQINLDGTPSIKIYALAEDTPPAPTYATKEELETAIMNLTNLINSAERKENNESTTPKRNNNATVSF